MSAADTKSSAPPAAAAAARYADVVSLPAFSHFDASDITDPDFPFTVLAREAKELWLPSTIERIPVPSPLQFYSDYVAKNKPVIITGAIDHWNALGRWTHEYLRQKLANSDVTIDSTPDGHGDTVRGPYFVTPREEVMKFPAFLDLLERKTKAKGVHYCQHQNGSFNSEFKALAGDLNPIHRTRAGASEIAARFPDLSPTPKSAEQTEEEKVLLALHKLQMKKQATSGAAAASSADMKSKTKSKPKPAAAAAAATATAAGGGKPKTGRELFQSGLAEPEPTGDDEAEDEDEYNEEKFTKQFNAAAAALQAKHSADAKSNSAASAAAAAKAAEIAHDESDCVNGLSWATSAFGAAPALTNMWFGDDRAYSSLHHDHFENIYAVITGVKHFTIYPPTDFYWLGKKWYEKAHYEVDAKSGEYVIVPDPAGTPLVPWFPPFAQPPTPDVQSVPTTKQQTATATAVAAPAATTAAEAARELADIERRRARATPFNIVLKAGEVLYLPSLWYHAVGQRATESSQGTTCAINFWYDMAHDSRYAYFRFMESIAALKQANKI